MTLSSVQILFVLGGARSGKSRYAQARAEAISERRIYIATAQAFDAEMEERIAMHQADRGEGWETVEAPFDLPDAIVAHAAPDRVVLVDCLTLWASNLLLADQDAEAETERLIKALGRAMGQVILVANEVGLGIVPDNALARRFRDIAGRINQATASAANECVVLFAGLPMVLKGGEQHGDPLQVPG